MGEILLSFDGWYSSFRICETYTAEKYKYAIFWQKLRQRVHHLVSQMWIRENVYSLLSRHILLNALLNAMENILVISWPTLSTV